MFHLRLDVRRSHCWHVVAFPNRCLNDTNAAADLLKLVFLHLEVIESDQKVGSVVSANVGGSIRRLVQDEHLLGVPKPNDLTDRRMALHLLHDRREGLQGSSWYMSDHISALAPLMCRSRRTRSIPDRE